MIPIHKPQVDNALALKANTSDTYTQTQIDNALAFKANSVDVYTQNHIDYVIEIIKSVYDRRRKIKGLKIVKEPQYLRHLSAQLKRIG